MGCNCGKKKAGGYTVIRPDGTKATVASLSEAVSEARRSGGTYQRSGV